MNVMPPKQSEDVSILFERKSDELKNHLIDEFRKHIQEIIKNEFKSLTNTKKGRPS